MDGYREHPSEFDPPAAQETAPADDVTAAIGTDERRMHVRAYNYWVSLLDGRDYPSIEELEPEDVKEFAPHSVLLDFTCGRDNPATPYIGAAIREECGLGEGVRSTADIPSRSLLSRLTDHYLQIIANRAPIGFEAEFVNQRGDNICYRGILMPFSSDGDTIDFIYGVINWKQVDASSADQPIEAAIEPAAQAIDQAPGLDEVAEPVDEPAGIVVPMIEPEDEQPLFHPTAIADAGESAASPPPQFSWEDESPADADSAPEISLGEDAGLADRLWAARETAEAVKTADGRTRVALYRALALAYDFAIAAQDSPDDFAELLEESGVKAQARAPMTPIVKLVFGIDYDKARLTEFAAALSYARRQHIALGGFQPFIESQAGGLKGLVAAERQARRPDSAPDTRGEAARARLREATALSLSDLACSEEFGLVVTRRRPDGGYEAVAVVDDPGLIDRAIRRAD